MHKPLKKTNYIVNDYYKFCVCCPLIIPYDYISNFPRNTIFYHKIPRNTIYVNYGNSKVWLQLHLCFSVLHPHSDHLKTHHIVVKTFPSVFFFLVWYESDFFILLIYILNPFNIGYKLFFYDVKLVEEGRGEITTMWFFFRNDME